VDRVETPRPRSAATDRLFFAVYPDASARARMAVLAEGLRTTHRLAGRPFAPPRWHITLAMAGDHAGLSAPTIALARAAGDAVRATPFEVCLDRTTSFPRPRNRPCVLLVCEGSEALTAMHAALEARLLAAGLVTAPDRRFRPHLTLQYDDRGLPDAPIDPIAWTVRGFALMHSRLGQGRHEEIARWPLGG
jgi:2'-5' RNA ligase